MCYTNYSIKSLDREVSKLLSLFKDYKECSSLTTQITLSIKK